MQQGEKVRARLEGEGSGALQVTAGVAVPSRSSGETLVTRVVGVVTENGSKNMAFWHPFMAAVRDMGFIIGGV